MRNTNSIPDDLSTRLEGYSASAAAQTAGGRGLGEIAGYAAAAGAGLAMAGAADAAVVYSGVQNISVSGDPAAQATTGSFSNISATGIDMDGNGADATLAAGMAAQLGTASGGTIAAKYFGGGAVEGAGGAALLGSGTFAGADNLPAGALIGLGGNFGDSSAGRVRAALVNTATGTYGSISAGNFGFTSTGFVGIRLGSGSYGWIRLHVEDLGLNQPFSTLRGGNPIGNGQNYPDKITVIDWAYDDRGAVGCITAGQTTGETANCTVPTPTPLALLAAGAAGLAAFRRRKAKPAASA